jgi:3-isopropylmalate/(R)-2-methylmalate dehydratase small subunit
VERIKGRVWKFGDSINTDVIIPGEFLASPIDVAKKHVLEAINPRFAKEVRQGDILVAGKNFGCGSSRESAPQALKSLGLGAVVAESFARIFFRNAIAIGLPVLSCPNVSPSFKDGDEIELDLEKAEVVKPQSGLTLTGDALPGQMLEVLNKGGIKGVLKEMFGG